MNGSYQVGDLVLGDWRLTKLLGQGSYGKVFEGEREDFGITYKAAIKIITIPQSQSEIQSARAEGLDDASVTAYFRSMVEEMVQEFGIMSRLKGNSNIVSYEDHKVIPHTDEIGWDIIIRMECLRPMLDAMGNRVMDPREVAKVGVDMCKALELCKMQSIIHRDIKPENMFVNDLGDYKLGDFGIARTIDRGGSSMSKKGTYTYMAPEIYKEEPYDALVDIYSLGIVLYRLINNNRAPFLPLSGPITHSQREQALLRRMSGAPLPPPCGAEGVLADIVMKACAYRPADRWQTPTDMRQALERYLLGGETGIVQEGIEEEATVFSPPSLQSYAASLRQETQEEEGTVSAASTGRLPTVEEEEGTVSAVAFSAPVKPAAAEPIHTPVVQTSVSPPPMPAVPSQQPSVPAPAAMPLKESKAAISAPSSTVSEQKKPIPQHPEPLKEQTSPSGKKGKGGIVAAVLLVVVIGIIAALYFSGILSKPKTSDAAQTEKTETEPVQVTELVPEPTEPATQGSGNNYIDDNWDDKPIYDGE